MIELDEYEFVAEEARAVVAAGRAFQKMDSTLLEARSMRRDGRIPR